MLLLEDGAEDEELGAELLELGCGALVLDCGAGLLELGLEDWLEELGAVDDELGVGTLL